MQGFWLGLPVLGFLKPPEQLHHRLVIIFVGLADVLGSDDIGECDGAIDDR